MLERWIREIMNRITDRRAGERRSASFNGKEKHAVRYYRVDEILFHYLTAVVLERP